MQFEYCESQHTKPHNKSSDKLDFAKYQALGCLSMMCGVVFSDGVSKFVLLLSLVVCHKKCHINDSFECCKCCTVLVKVSKWPDWHRYVKPACIPSAFRNACAWLAKIMTGQTFPPVSCHPTPFETQSSLLKVMVTEQLA